MTSSAGSASPGDETDVFRQFLVDTVQEVAASVSFSRFREILRPLTCARQELHDEAQHVMVQSMESVIDGLSQRNVGQKLKDLRELLKEYPLESREEAWRPKTGQVDTSSLEGQALEDRKAKLLEAIAAVDKQNEFLRKTIIERREILKTQKDQIEHLNI